MEMIRKITLTLIITLMMGSFAFITADAQMVYAASDAGSVSATGVSNIKKGNNVTVVFKRVAPSGTSIYSLSGQLKWDDSILKIKTIEGTNGVAPVTEETLKDASSSLKNKSPKNVSFSIVGAAKSTETKVVFEVLKEKDSEVTWTLKEKGTGAVQANVGDGEYERGGVPIDKISGLSKDGSVTASVGTGEVKNSVDAATQQAGNEENVSAAGNDNSGNNNKTDGNKGSSSNDNLTSNSSDVATGSTDSNNSGFTVGGDNEGNLFQKAARGDGMSIGIIVVIIAVIAAVIALIGIRKHRKSI